MTTGIYAFKSLTNGKMYIGYSSDLLDRKNEHLALLRKGKHHSVKLQRHFVKYGEKDLVYGIIEFCNLDVCMIQETFWIAAWDSFAHGFNCTEGGEGFQRPAKLFSFENIKTHEVIENITVYEFCNMFDSFKSTVWGMITKSLPRTCKGWTIKGRNIPPKKTPTNAAKRVPLILKNITTGQNVWFASRVDASKQIGTSISNLLCGKTKVLAQHWMLAK